MKKKLLSVVLLVCLICAAALTACQQQVTLTLYDNDGKTVIKTLTVNRGGVAVKPQDPTKDGFTFKGWFITPTNAKEFDFSQPLNEDAKAYAQWQTADYTDTRDWVLVGTPTSWAAAEGYHFTKSATKGNEYTLTIDVDLNDAFKCTVLNADGKLDYENSNGANVGYALLKNAGDNFTSGEGLGDAPKNIVCAVAGNYTFTLKTDEDNNNNELTAVRNGDMVGGNEEPVGAVTTYYLKGNMVTDWKDFVADTTSLKQSATDKDVYTLEIYLKATDEFMFASVVTENGVTTPGKTIINMLNLDETSKTLFEGTGNIKVKESGKYTFTYNSTTKALSAAVDKTYTPAEADYYIDGTFNGVEADDWKNYCFKSEYKLTQDAEKDYLYTIEHVHMLEGKQVIVQAFKKGATERGEWGKDNYNGLGSYNYKCLLDNANNFSAVSKDNQNILIKNTSDYKITLNVLSGMIVIEDENIVDEAYIYGTMTGDGWKVDPAWKMTYDATAKTYTITKAFAVDDQFGIRVCVGNDTANQRSWAASSNVSETPEGFDISNNNIKCTTAGTYTVTIDLSGETAVITIAVAAE